MTLAITREFSGGRWRYVVEEEATGGGGGGGPTLLGPFTVNFDDPGMGVVANDGVLLAELDAGTLLVDAAIITTVAWDGGGDNFIALMFCKRGQVASAGQQIAERKALVADNFGDPDFYAEYGNMNPNFNKTLAVNDCDVRAQYQANNDSSAGVTVIYLAVVTP